MIANTNQVVDQEKYGDNWDRIWGENKIEEYPDPAVSYVYLLDNLDGSDPESNHMSAVEFLLEFLRVVGFEEVSDAYERFIARCD